MPRSTPRPIVKTILRTLGAATAAALVLLPLAAAPAAATIIDRDHYSVDYTDSFDDCGFWVDITGNSHGTAQIRVGTGNLASAFFVHDNYEFLETWTRRDTGAFITISGNGLFHETGATHVSGTVFDFTSINAGQPVVVRNAAGEIVARDRGVIRQVIRFDTLGDDQPGGAYVADVAFTVHGPHPGLDFDPCPLFQ